ncbi:MAG: hypothetical protein E5V80_22835, partial [Mesorhizobium sp.]
MRIRKDLLTIASYVSGTFNRRVSRMTSMRFPRANLSGASAYHGDDDRGADGRRGGVPQAQTGQVVALRVAPASESEAARAASSESADGEFSRPAWQDYFFLAPNVRFTR